MVEKVNALSCDVVVDFARYQSDRNANTGKSLAIPARACRHCGAALFAGENEEECSSIFNVDAAGQHGEQRMFCAE